MAGAPYESGAGERIEKEIVAGTKYIGQLSAPSQTPDGDHQGTQRSNFSLIISRYRAVSVTPENPKQNLDNTNANNYHSRQHHRGRNDNF